MDAVVVGAAVRDLGTVAVMVDATDESNTPPKLVVVQRLTFAILVAVEETVVVVVAIVAAVARVLAGVAAVVDVVMVLAKTAATSMNTRELR